MPNLNASRSARAAAELLARRKARRNLAEWARMCGYVPARHHLLLVQYLERVARGEIDRLMVWMPPGSAKSTYSTVLFPPWFLEKAPEKLILGISHTAELAHEFGRRIRNLVSNHAPQLGYGLREDSKAAGRWNTEKDGGFYGAGVGGNITGRRADLGLIDDPVKSRKEADSELVQRRQYEWYRFDFLTRLKPGAPIIIIQTRWNEADLSGRILADEGRVEEGGKWTVVRLPMEAEEDDPLGRQPGERLWPEWFTPQMVADAKLDPRVWGALYQQDPTPEGGNFFKAEWLLGYQAGDLPVNLHVYMGSDHAVSEEESADYTVALCVGMDEAGVLWVLPDAIWDRADSATIVDKLIDMIERRRPMTWLAEKGHISKAIGPFLRERMMKRRVYCQIEEITPTTDKKSRAQAIKDRMAMGLVRFPRFAPWWADAQRQLLAFPAGAHDDFVDALAHIGGAVDKLSPAMARRHPTLGEAIEEQEQGSRADQQTALGLWAG